MTEENRRRVVVAATGVGVWLALVLGFWRFGPMLDATRTASAGSAAAAVSAPATPAAGGAAATPDARGRIVTGSPGALADDATAHARWRADTLPRAMVAATLVAIVLALTGAGLRPAMARAAEAAEEDAASAPSKPTTTRGARRGRKAAIALGERGVPAAEIARRTRLSQDAVVMLLRSEGLLSATHAADPAGPTRQDRPSAA